MLFFSNRWKTYVAIFALTAVMIFSVSSYLSATQTPSELDIVVAGQPQAVVLLGANPDPQTNQAAQTLVDYVYKSTGAALPLMTADELTGSEQALIYVGSDAAAAHPSLVLDLTGMDDHGFSIQYQGNSIVIAGPAGWGTMNGVLEFLERYVGVRWLFPGPDGEDVPQLTDLTVTKENVAQEPAFTYRVISPANASPYTPGTRQPLNEWALKNRLQGSHNGGIVFIHNLFTLFPPEKYGTSNPEFYPNGNPPAPGTRNGWQPCFTAQGAVEAAVYGILEYFQANPGKQYFSLGVNDMGGYCEASPSHPHYPGKMNSVGVVDMSDIYYEWVNEVVEQVLLVYPDKWFGLLAYQNVMDPPSFPVHPRVVPFITKDRMTWADSGIKADGQQQMDDWNGKASQLAWYDYMYGTFYLLPRVYPHLMAENYRYAKENNVIANYTEMYFNIGDGPKAWVSAKLQWDPYQDVDALLDEWYVRMVGPAAAPDLAEYFELWERFWTERIPQSSWFQNSKEKIYLPFTEAPYLNLVTANELDESKQLLASVAAKAVTDEQQTRASLLQRVFEYYEATILSYTAKPEPPATENDALALLESIAEADPNAPERHQELIESFKSDPALRLHIEPRVEWTKPIGFDFWNLANYVTAHEPNGGAVTQEVSDLAANGDSPYVRQLAALLLQTQTSAPLTVNASFENGGTQATSWANWITGAGSIRRTETAARSGQASLLIRGMARGGPAQTFDVEPGLAAAQVHYYTPVNTVTNGTIQLTLNLKSAQGKTLSTLQTSATPLSKTVGSWSSIGILENIPAAVGNAAVEKLQIVVVLDNMGTGVEVYVDDAVVYQNSPAPPAP